VPALRTEITEIVTGLGMLAFVDVEAALNHLPPEMQHVSDEVWCRVRDAARDGTHRQEFAAAFANGTAFLEAREALRGRRPITIEWRGPKRAPGDEVVPADLRIDHVYLVSCKYLSRILVNASPAYLFERALAGPQGTLGADWFCEVAPAEYQALYHETRAALGNTTGLPPRATDLTAAHRVLLKREIPARAAGVGADAYRDLVARVAGASADRWRATLARKADRERMLWRLLRMTAAPYFVLGTADGRSLRVRVETPWEWRVRHDLRRFDVWAGDAGQPVVHWRAVVQDHSGGADVDVDGHVEVRWSHGRFAQPPEAKVYLDTPHHRVPGYVPLA
jgi:hypothetical protein